MKTCETTVYQHSKGGTIYITIASKMASDSAFPFKAGDRVLIKAKGSKLEVSKA